MIISSTDYDIFKKYHEIIALHTPTSEDIFHITYSWKNAMHMGSSIKYYPKKE